MSVRLFTEEETYRKIDSGNGNITMQILLIGFSKIKYMPYMHFYLDNIDRKKNTVSLVYWNRDLQKEDLGSVEGVNLFEFKHFQLDDVSKIKKLKSFFCYKKYVQKVLKQKRYDLIIVMHSLPAVLLKRNLCHYYKNKYIFDYRDSTYEKIPLYKKIINKIIKSSKITFTSSDGFRVYFDKQLQDKVYTTHNILLDSLDHQNDKELYNISSDKIRIAFWGFIRHEEINKEIIRKIASDMRFELHYYGREQQVALNLKEYAKKIGAGNVFFHGEYTSEERYKFILTTDIIHNIYYDTNTMLAMGNKYYDGMIFKIPQLCFEGSFMGRQAAESGIGFECNPYDKDFCEKIYSYYRKIDKKDFFDCCVTSLKETQAEYNNAKDLINKTL